VSADVNRVASKPAPLPRPRATLRDAPLPFVLSLPHERAHHVRQLALPQPPSPHHIRVHGDVVWPDLEHRLRL